MFINPPSGWARGTQAGCRRHYRHLLRGKRTKESRKKMGTFSVPLRRQDSFGLQFSSYPSMPVVRDALCNCMEIPLDDILGVTTAGRNRIIVKVVPSLFNDLMKKYEDKRFTSEKLGSFYVKNLSSSLTYVSIRNAPFEMSDEALISLLSRYGKVQNMRNNRYAHGPFEGKLTGVRTATMQLKENIPSSITFHGYTISFIYNGQTRTCYRCGSTGHMIKDCDYDMEKNKFSDEEYPEINSKKGAQEKDKPRKADEIDHENKETEAEPENVDKDKEEKSQCIEVVENDEEKSKEVDTDVEQDDEMLDETQDQSDVIKSQEIGACEMKISTTRVMFHQNMYENKVNDGDFAIAEEREKDDDIDMDKGTGSKENYTIDEEDNATADQSEKDTDVKMDKETVNEDNESFLEMTPGMTDSIKKIGTWHSRKDKENALKITLKKNPSHDNNYVDVSDVSDSSEDMFKSCSKKLKSC